MTQTPIMDVYEILRVHAKRGSVRMSISNIADATGLSMKQVRIQLDELKKSGHITIIACKNPTTGAELANEYLLTGRRTEPVSTLAAQVKAAYCSQASERVNRKFLPSRSFVGYTKVFENIGGFCKELKLDPYIYVLACFHTFPVGWCNKTFGSPFPPPYILANKSKAEERYNALLRFISQHTVEETKQSTETELFLIEHHSWKTLGKPKAVSTVRQLIENGTLSIEFVKNSHDFTKEEKERILKGQTNV